MDVHLWNGSMMKLKLGYSRDQVVAGAEELILVICCIVKLWLIERTAIVMSGGHFRGQHSGVDRWQCGLNCEALGRFRSAAADSC